VLSLAPLLACGGGGSTVLADGGDTVPRCSGARICEGRVLRACVDGHVGDQIEDCGLDGRCSLGRCTSSACAAVEHDKDGFAGCVFYTVEVNNVARDADKATSFLVTNPGGETAEVKLERHVGATWSLAGTATIAAGTAARLPIAGLQIELSGPNDGGLRLTASQPVTVAQIQSDDENHVASSSGGTMLLPIQVLGRRHLVMAYPQKQTAAIAAMPDSPGGAGRLLVVGTKAGTEVILTASPHASIVVAGSFPGLEAGEDYPFTLGEGDVFQVWSGGEDQDLSGTEIKASEPIAVFSGNITTTYGRTGIDVQSPDMVHEQMPPTAHWSFKYVAAALPPQANTCDTLLGQPGMSLWRILSANDDTVVKFISPDPSRPVHANTPLKAGEVLELMADVDFVVEADWPVLMTQGIDCEPSLSLAISADELLHDLTFAVLPAFDQMVAIARMQNQPEPVLLDGVPVKDALFVPAGGGYEVARVLLEPPCPPSKLVCTHQLQGSFGMTLRGMDVIASYALTAPAWKGCNDLLDCVN
jgi:hypothetical protein